MASAFCRLAGSVRLKTRFMRASVMFAMRGGLAVVVFFVWFLSLLLMLEA